MVKIKNYASHTDDYGDGDFILFFEIDEEDDGFLLQRIFRDLVSANLSTESYFGFGDGLKEVLEFDYPVGRESSLTYKTKTSEIDLSVKKE